MRSNGSQERNTPIGGVHSVDRATEPASDPKNAIPFRTGDTKPLAAINAAEHQTSVVQKITPAENDDIPIIIEEPEGDIRIITEESEEERTKQTQHDLFLEAIWSDEPPTDPITAAVFQQWKNNELPGDISPALFEAAYKTIKEAQDKQIKIAKLKEIKQRIVNQQEAVTIRKAVKTGESRTVSWPLHTPETPANRSERRDIGTIPRLVRYAGETTAGGPVSKYKDRNEDGFIFHHDTDGSFSACVIDGAGGSGKNTSVQYPGYVAKEIALDSFTTHIRSSQSLDRVFDHVSLDIENNPIWPSNASSNERGYACGGAARLHKDGMVELVGAGDARALLYSQSGVLREATEMQNLAVAFAGGDTEKALINDAYLNNITNGLGTAATEENKFKNPIDRARYNEVSYVKTNAYTGDIILLVSDGVSDVVTETELSSLVAQYSNDPTRLQEEILHLAYTRNNLKKGESYTMRAKNGKEYKKNADGSGDNITVQVVRVEIPNLTEGTYRLKSIIAENFEDSAQTPSVPTIQHTTETKPTQTTGPMPSAPIQKNTTPPVWKRVGKWAAGIAVAGLAAFGISSGRDRQVPDAHTTEPVRVTQTAVPETGMVFSEAEVQEDYSQIQPEAAQQAISVAQEILDRAIDAGEANAQTLTRTLAQELAQRLGRTTADQVVTSVRDLIETFTQELNQQHWGSVVRTSQDVTRVIQHNVEVVTPRAYVDTPRQPLVRSQISQDTVPQRVPISAGSVDMSRYTPQPETLRTTSLNIEIPVPQITARRPQEQRPSVSPINRPDLAQPIPHPTTEEVREVFENLRPEIPDSLLEQSEQDDEEEGTLELQADDLQEVKTIRVNGTLIAEGSIIDIKSKQGNTVRYRVLDITDQNGPNRLILQSLDGKIRTFKDIRTLEQNPTVFHVVST